MVKIASSSRQRAKVNSNTKLKSLNRPKSVLRRKKRPRESPNIDFSDAEWSTAESDPGSENEKQKENGLGRADSASDTTAESNIANDPFASIESIPANKGRGEICELHTYDSREDSRGEIVILRTGSKSEIDFEHERSPEAALVLTRYFTFLKEIYSTELEIKSPYIKAAFEEIAGSYPGVNFGSDSSMTVFDEPQCLFHYRKELKDYAETCSNPRAKEHVLFCLKYMARCLRSQISAYNTMMENNERAPGLEFRNLWMVFRPNDLLYTTEKGTGMVLRLKRMEMIEKTGKADSHDKWTLTIERIQYDGTTFGRTHTKVNITEYHGYKALSELPVYPLQYHKEKEIIREELIIRGKRFVSLAGVHYCMYDGMAEMVYPSDPYMQKEEIQSVEVRHRVVIDCHEFTVSQRRTPIQFVSESEIETHPNKQMEMTDNEYLICHHEMAGFSLTRRRWAYFNVARLTDIDFNTNASSNLVLSHEKKNMISSMLQMPQNGSVSFDDLIKGKGKGLIFLLHGPPGVGKTFTAESIAEFTRRPLYTVSSGELSAFGPGVSAERPLDIALSLATRWKAVVLIDEADVFMEERRFDSYRNERVSVLLRTLEYFEGILFLTTNRVEVIDPAFKSRIHFSIAYPNLSAESRRELWKVFLAQGSKNGKPHWLDDKFLKEISDFELNGRQIKNAIRVSHALAASDNRDIDPGDIYSVVQASKSFERDFHNSAKQNLIDRTNRFVPPLRRAQGVSSDPLRSLLRKCLPGILTDTTSEIKRYADDFVKEVPPETISPFVDKFARLLASLIGGACLIVPKLMINPDIGSNGAGLIQASFAVVVFSFLLSVGSKANNPETLVASAAYTAVLLGFVSAS